MENPYLSQVAHLCWKIEAIEGGRGEWREVEGGREVNEELLYEREFRMERTATAADVRGQKSGHQMLIFCCIYVTDLSRVCDLAGSATTSSSPFDHAFPCPNSVEIFSEEIMKFQKWWGRDTLYHLSSLPLPLLSPGPSECPSCSYVGLRKAPATPKPLFKPSVSRECRIFTERLLIQLWIWSQEVRLEKPYTDGLKCFPALALAGWSALGYRLSSSRNFITVCNRISNWDAVDGSKSVLACSWFHFYGFKHVFQTQGSRKGSGVKVIRSAERLLYVIVSVMLNTPPERGPEKSLSGCFSWEVTPCCMELGALKPCCFIPSEKYQAGNWVTQTRSKRPKRI